MKKNRRFQFSIRLMLILSLVAAITFMIVFLRPEPVVQIRVQNDGVTTVEGQLASFKELAELVEQERTWRERWFVEPTFSLIVDRETSADKVMEVAEVCQNTGVEKMTLSVSKEE